MSKNIEMNYLSSSGYETLFPSTLSSLVTLSNSITEGNLNDGLNFLNTAISSVESEINNTIGIIEGSLVTTGDIRNYYIQTPKIGKLFIMINKFTTSPYLFVVVNNARSGEGGVSLINSTSGLSIDGSKIFFENNRVRLANTESGQYYYVVFY